MKIRALAAVVVVTALFASVADAQNLSIKDFKEASAVDLSARVKSRNDLNGNPCALVRVELPLEGAGFEGNVIGLPDFRINEYWVYMSTGSKHLKIHAPGHASLFINFPDFGVDRIISRHTYELTLNAKNGDLRSFTEIPDSVWIYPVKRNGKWGYIDKTGKIIVPAVYDEACTFKTNVAPVTLNGKKGYMDKSGRIVIAPVYDDASAFNGNYAGIKSGEKYGVINNAGQIVVPAIYDGPYIAYIGEDRIQANLNGKWGLIDTLGRMIVAPQYDFVYSFSEGLCKVKKDDKNYFIDRDGKTVLSVPLKSESEFKMNCLAAADGGDRWGFLDKSGKWDIAPGYEEARSFDEETGLAPVKKNGKWGFVDRKGKMVINPRFDDAGSFENGLSYVVLNGVGTGLINKKGEYVVKPQYSSVWSQGGGIYNVIVIDDNGRVKENYYINSAGKKIADCSDGL